MPEEIKALAEVVVTDSKDASMFLAKEIVDGVEVATPIQPQKQAVTPNAVYIPQIVIHTGIENGVLKSAIQFLVAPIKYDNGVWSGAGQAESIFIDDIANPSPDIAHLSKEIGVMYSNAVAIIVEINRIRQAV